MDARSQRPFLSARWLDLCIASFRVDDALLDPFLPPGLELDRLDGSACVSLVGFMFLDSRLRGRRIPGYGRFPELNLRFYVARTLATGERRRGVVFIREYVPKRAVAMIARTLYNEPYRIAPMTGARALSAEEVAFRYTVRIGRAEHVIEATGDAAPFQPAESSIEHFFKEHRWGYGRDRAGRALEYEVRHPVWRVFPVRGLSLDIDWGLLYGSTWEQMNGRGPDSVVLAEGSAVEVYDPIRP